MYRALCTSMESRPHSGRRGGSWGWPGWWNAARLISLAESETSAACQPRVVAHVHSPYSVSEIDRPLRRRPVHADVGGGCPQTPLRCQYGMQSHKQRRQSRSQRNEPSASYIAHLIAVLADVARFLITAAKSDTAIACTPILRPRFPSLGIWGKHVLSPSWPPRRTQMIRLGICH